MKKITNIKIGPYDYTVIHGPIISEDSGLCLPSKLEIYINTHESEERETDTLLHECLHALWDVFNLGESCDEETAVRALASGLIMLIKDNPDIKQRLVKIKNKKATN